MVLPAANATLIFLQAINNGWFQDKKPRKKETTNYEQVASAAAAGPELVASVPTFVADFQSLRHILCCAQYLCQP